MLEQHLYRLNNIQPHLRGSVGDKAYYLGLAIQSGYPVIPGVVISAHVFTHFLEKIQWLEPFLSDLPNSSLHFNVDDTQQLQSVAQQLRQAICNSSFPPDWSQLLESSCQSFSSSHLICRPSIAFSTDHDPSLNLQIRGLLSSFVCSVNANAIAQAVLNVWAEPFHARGLTVWKRAGIQIQHLQVGVLIQPISSAFASGNVTPCIDQLNLNQLEVEATWGLGHAIKMGETIPDRYLVERDSGTLVMQNIGQKSYAYGFSGDSAPSFQPSIFEHDVLIGTTPQMPHLHVYPVAMAYQDISVLSADGIRKIANLSQSLSTHFESPTTFEWVLYPSPFFQDAHIPDSELILKSSISVTPPYQNSRLYLTQILPQATLRHSRFVDRNQENYQTHSRPSFLIREASHPNSTNYDRTLKQPTSPTSHPFNSSSSTDTSVVIPITTALGASSGQVIGPAWIISNQQSVEQLPTGYILVANDITPDWMLDIKRAVAIVSERGGMTCHAAIVARELGIPAIVGAVDVVNVLHTGDTLLINGDRGTIHRIEHLRQRQSTTISEKPIDPLRTTQSPNQSKPIDRTTDSSPSSINRYSDDSSVDEQLQTMQLMVSISQLESLTSLKQMPIDGIGLLRGELLLPSLLNPQAKSSILQDNRQRLVEGLSDYLHQFLEVIHPSPVYYRAVDLRSHEFSKLLKSLKLDGEKQPPISLSESNPLLGIHGTLSYVRNPSFFHIELEAIRQLREAGYKNLHLILPFVRTVEEFKACRQWILDADLLHMSNFEVWVMAEVPSILFLLSEYVDAGVSGIAIGTNDLTQLILAIDRNHPELSNDFNQKHPAVLRAMKQLITTARNLKIPCSICGEMPSQYPDLIKQLMKWGATSVSVNPYAIESTYDAIAQAKRELIMHRNMED